MASVQLMAGAAQLPQPSRLQVWVIHHCQVAQKGPQAPEPADPGSNTVLRAFTWATPVVGKLGPILCGHSEALGAPSPGWSVVPAAVHNFCLNFGRLAVTLASPIPQLGKAWVSVWKVGTFVSGSF